MMNVMPKISQIMKIINKAPGKSIQTKSRIKALIQSMTFLHLCYLFRYREIFEKAAVHFCSGLQLSSLTKRIKKDPIRSNA